MEAFEAEGWGGRVYLTPTGELRLASIQLSCRATSTDQNGRNEICRSALLTAAWNGGSVEKGIRDL